MTTPSFAAQDHAAALTAAIEAEFGPWEVYEYGKVPGLDGNPGWQGVKGEAPPIYGLVQVSRRYLPATNLVRVTARTGWRASIRAVGRTSSECWWALDRISTALDSRRLTVAGKPSSRLEHETTDDPEPDKGRHSALVRFTYTL